MENKVLGTIRTRGVLEDGRVGENLLRCTYDMFEDPEMRGFQLCSE